MIQQSMKSGHLLCAHLGLVCWPGHILTVATATSIAMILYFSMAIMLCMRLRGTVMLMSPSCCSNPLALWTALIRMAAHRFTWPHKMDM